MVIGWQARGGRVETATAAQQFGRMWGWGGARGNCGDGRPRAVLLSAIRATQKLLRALLTVRLLRAARCAERTHRAQRTGAGCG